LIMNISTIAKSVLEKRAAGKEIIGKAAIGKFNWGTARKLLTIAGISITAGVFIEKILDALKEAGVRAKSSLYYQKMLDAHPELLKEDPVEVAAYWASLYHFAPTMAQEPMAAGAFIRQSIMKGVRKEFGGPPADTYATLTGIEDKLRADKKTVLDKAFATGIASGFGKLLAEAPFLA